MIDDLIKKERGQRIKMLRKHTHLSRRAFGNKHGIASGTLQYWEDGNFGGLSEEGASKLIDAFAKEGIWATAEWLMHGSGKEPSIDPYRFAGSNTNLVKELLIREAHQSTNSIIQELKFFLRLHPMAIHEVVSDDFMLPRLTSGEYVAGIQKFEDEIDSLVDKDCIIKLKNNKTYIRCIKTGTNADQYTLISTNSLLPIDLIAVAKDDILSAAAIIWARRDEG